MCPSLPVVAFPNAVYMQQIRLMLNACQILGFRSVGQSPQHFPSSRLALYVFPSFSSCSVSFFCFQKLFAQYLGFSRIFHCVCVYVQHDHSFTCMIESCSSHFYVQKRCFLLSPFIFNGLHSCSLNFIQTH